MNHLSLLYHGKLCRFRGQFWSCVRVLLSVCIECLSKLVSYNKMNYGKFCGFKLSVKISPRDIIEWLHGINGINKLSINVCPREVHSMNEHFQHSFSCHTWYD